jgi:hypothetical protein
MHIVKGFGHRELPLLSLEPGDDVFRALGTADVIEFSHFC